MHPDALTLDIVDLDDEGRGVGHDSDVRVHVAGALPGDRARVSLEHRSPHQPAAWARLVTLEAESPSRVTPVCPATGRCGGCLLGAFDYGAQLAWKERRLAGALDGLHTPAQLVPSQSASAYRNSARLVYGRPRRDAAVCLGGYAPRSHHLVDLAGCRVIEAPLEEVRGAVLGALRVRDVAPYDERTRQGLLAYVALRGNARGEVLVTLVGPELTALEPLADLAATHPAIAGVAANRRGSGNAIFGRRTVTLAGRGELADEVGGVRVILSPTAFFQVNRAVATRIYADLADALLRHAPRSVVDAYAGVGGIALTLAARGVTEVSGIEVNTDAVRDAGRAAEEARLSVRFVAADAALGLRAEAATRAVDAVVVNPPRRGLDPAMRAAIGEIRPRLVAYVSCDPDTLARDLRELVAQGLTIESVRGYDMHPQTPHVEALAILTRA